MAGHKIVSLTLLFALALAACAPDVPAPPTLALTSTPIIITALPTATTIARPTLPPTWTPAADAPQPAEPAAPAATPTPEGASGAQFVPASPLPACATFGEDRELNSRTFAPGTAPQVFWTAVEGAASYSVALLNDAGETVFEGYTLEPTITFEADLFEPGRLYGWEAYPINPLGQQMCLARGAELFPEGLPGRQ
ncbi:MAG: hypothetical protein BroJett033_3690 [Chloroflexota bacterium]|nr:MAG: hypothetical protein BroJett033_3690 [Chloroflexota bacterium]